MPALALTDTNNMFGVLEFSDKLAGAGIQPIAGVSLAIDFEESKPSVTPLKGTPSRAPRRNRDGLHRALAMNELGYANLMKLVSKAHLGHRRHRRPAHHVVRPASARRRA